MTTAIYSSVTTSILTLSDLTTRRPNCQFSPTHSEEKMFVTGEDDEKTKGGGDSTWEGQAAHTQVTIFFTILISFYIFYKF